MAHRQPELQKKRKRTKVLLILNEIKILKLFPLGHVLIADICNGIHSEYMCAKMQETTNKRR